MEKKKSKSRRMKRANKEDNMWDCSVCTYRNSPEAFKCLMCDVRKGTSTRKPRLNAELVAAQVAQVLPPKPKKTERSHNHRKTEGRTHFKGRPRLKNVDRSTAEHNAVTVNNVTVIITEFQPKQKSNSGSNASSSGVTAAPSDTVLSTGTTSSLNGSSITSNNTSSGVVTNGSLTGVSEGGGDGSGVTGTMSSSEAGSVSDASESPNKHEIKAAEPIANKS